MVISRTPLRVSFVGGGSDLVSFARKYGGAVVATTIDKYIYVVVTDRFEIDILGKPIGKQDQYAAAFGGLQLLRFGPGDDVMRDVVVLTPESRSRLQRSLLMFYTGRQRSTARVLNGIDASISTPSVRRNLGKL